MGILSIRYAEEEKEEFKNEILPRLKKGYSKAEISREIGISETTTRKLIDELVADPNIDITKKEIEERQRERQRKRRREENQQRINAKAGSKSSDNKRDEPKQPIDENELKSRVLYLLNIIGIGKLQIRHVLDITVEQFENIKNELINENKTSDRAIEAAAEKREIDNTEKIYLLRMQGLSYSEIASQIEYADISYVKRMLKKLTKEGRLSKKKLIKETKEKKEMPKQNFIFDRLIRGFTAEEMIEEYNENHSKDKLSRRIVSRISKKIIEENEGIEKIIEKARVARRGDKNQARQAEGKYDTRIYKLFSLGFDQKQISIITGLGATYIYTRKRRLKAQGKLLDIGPRKLIASREPMADKRRNDITKMVGYEKNIDLETVQDHIEYAKAKFALGEIELEDMQLISRVIPMQRELMELGNINFVIKYFMEGDYLRPAVNFINECLSSIHDDEVRKKRKININKRKGRKKNTRTRKGEKTKQTR